MNEQDPVLSILVNDKIVDEESLKSILDKQQKTGRSLVSILKGELIATISWFSSRFIGMRLCLPAISYDTK